MLVFYLSSGDLATYETVVTGRAVDPVTDAMVNDCLKEEAWWNELQTLRGRPKSMSASQELDSLANVVESTAGRPGIFNPHNDHEAYGERRRHSLARVSEFPKKPTVSTLARLGVNMGIHTANLLPNVFDSSSEDHSGSTSEIDTDASDDEGNADFNDDASAASEGDLEHLEPVRRPLLSSPGRRKSYNDVQFGQLREPLVRRKQVQVDKISRSPSATTRATTSYGTMSPALIHLLDEEEAVGGSSSNDSYRPNLAAVSNALLDIDRPATPRRGLSRNASRDQVNTKIHTPKPMRPAFSRQSTHQGVRFSSQVLPQTEITEPEGESGPVLGFAESDEQQDRPALSRSTSQLRLSSRNPSNTKIYQGEHARPGVLSAPARETRPWTEPPSPGEAVADVSINIPDLLATYKFQDAPEEGEVHNDATANVVDEVNPSLPLSFNDLPSRAQYLILNELLRQNSSDSAVLYTTLPIPTEGTCRSEETSVQYLSDIEVLCNDLPPVLLVLSNNMTYVYTARFSLL